MTQQQQANDWGQAVKRRKHLIKLESNRMLLNQTQPGEVLGRPHSFWWERNVQVTLTVW